MKKLACVIALLLCSTVFIKAQNIDSLAKNPKTNVIAVGLVKTSLFGEPRTPLKTSFYSSEMARYDWRSRFREPKEHTLFGLEEKINSEGKVIVYDASVTTIPNGTESENEGIKVNTNNALITSGRKTLQIPIEFTGDKSIDKNSITKGEKSLISDYINKSLKSTGVTPSKVNIVTKKGDFNINIEKSKFTGEDVIIKGYNLRSRNEIKEAHTEIKGLIDRAELQEAQSKLKVISIKYPETKKFAFLKEKYKTLAFLKSINEKSRGVNALFIEDGVKEYKIYDGLKPQATYDVLDKNGIIGSISKDASVVYLDVNSLNSDKAAAYIASVRIQMKRQRPEVRVEVFPKDMASIFFEGKVSSTKEAELHTYNVKTNGSIQKIRLTIKIEADILKSKADSFIKKFFRKLNKIISGKKEWNLSDAINETTKKMKRSKSVGPDDYKIFITNELGETNIVSIEGADKDKLMSIGYE